MDKLAEEKLVVEFESNPMYHISFARKSAELLWNGFQIDESGNLTAELKESNNTLQFDLPDTRQITIPLS